ncbi:shikimate 5-dehydrogenase [Caldicellulosiruptor hydrothermalis 108]|uniref:Shikimate dehydrogenase (NADP(+)) n=1 Tax=Caldicellulosiruptor hydrothermalis (strain DSM 18901 / VKM B-2411 / 108) TaxID=632292 RepID=E4Q7B1_CALH1|nr:shikimate dehydrogenase [Caldicellulosiruptor hydrothermalis]ADQ06624.1 shikimate 5-dehydrogenase [Caldicellulosiruptor hydrothermalis 108]
MKKLFLIGKSLKHSISPFIHNTILSEFDIDAIYSNLELSDTEKLKEFVEMVRKDKDVVGFNITIPYKEDILEFCDEVSEDVRIIKAANTVKKEDGKFLAYNTDWIGFKKSLEDRGGDVKDKKILILGSGGAAKACIYGLYRMGAKEVFIANRTYEKAQALRQQYKEIVDLKIIKWSEIENVSYDILINTTPIGMYPDVDISPINTLNFTVELVYDMIYNPYKTKLLQLAEINGKKILNGLPMLIYQAIEAEKIWFGIEPDKEMVSLIHTLAKSELERIGSM